MTHRADQIIDAIESRLLASTTLAVSGVFAHRSLSLAEDQGELPAVTVNCGADEPAEEYTLLGGEIGSQLEVLTVAYCVGITEPEVKRELLRLRMEAHKAIDMTEVLDLDFVVKVEYGGATAPEIDSESQVIAGSQESRWLITYVMNPDDPS
jgi:hypothetical protein